MPLVETRASGTAQAYGLLSSVTPPPYLIDQLLDTVNYVGTGSAQTISTNLVNLSLDGGGMLWIKNCTAGGWYFFDTKTGTGKYYQVGTAITTDAQTVTAFGDKTVTLGTSATTNGSGVRYLMTVFKQRTGFFDFQVYTGNGTTRTLPHGLGYVPSQTLTWRTGATPSLTTQSNSVVGTTNWGNGATQFSAVPNQISATFMTSLPDANNLYFGNDIKSNENLITYAVWLFGEAAIFGPSQNQQISFSANASGAATITSILMNNPHMLLGLSFSWGNNTISSSSGMTLYGGVSTRSNGGLNFYSSATAYNSSGSYPLVNGNVPFSGYTLAGTTGAMNTGPAISNSGTGTGWLTFVYPQKGMTYPASGNSICYYVAVSGTSQLFTIPFTWDLIFYHTDSRTGGDQIIVMQDHESANNQFTGRSMGTLAATNTDKSVSSPVISVRPQGCFNSIGTSATIGNLNRCIFVKTLANSIIPWSYRGSGNGTATQTFNHNFGKTPDALIYFQSTLALNTSWPKFGASLNGRSDVAIAVSTTRELYNIGATQITAYNDFNNTTNPIQGFAFFDTLNTVFVGTYTGTGSAQAVTLTGWTTTPSSIIIWSDKVFTTNGILFVGNLGASSSVTWNMNSGTSGVANGTDATITTYTSGSNYGFQVSAANSSNINTNVYYFIALK